MTIQEKSKELFDLRNKIATLDEEYDKKVSPLKVQRDLLQQAILEELKTSGQFSARFEFATVTRAVRKTLKIVDESKLVKYLKKNGMKEYVKETVNELFDVVKKEALKTEKKLPGCETQETEYISVRSAEDDERRKVVVE